MSRGAAMVLMLAAGLAAQSYGFLAGPGTRGAWLDGAPLLPGTAVLPGETVTTAPGGVLVLASSGPGGGVLEITGGGAATVRPGGALGPALQLEQGNALVVGRVPVVTAQGETIAPLSPASSFVLNAVPQRTSVGVLTGSVQALFASGPPQPGNVLNPGQALAFTPGAATGFTRIRMADLTVPPPTAGMPQVIPASQSQ